MIPLLAAMEMTMLGPKQVMQEALFYEFSLERHVPEGHLLRRIDALMDFSGVRDHLAPFYSNTGRPSVMDWTDLFLEIRKCRQIDNREGKFQPRFRAIP
jgi:transposase